MKKLIQYLVMAVALALILLWLSGCATMSHDYWNPCTNGPGIDPWVCCDWKTRYPREYAKYVERMKTRPFKEYELDSACICLGFTADSVAVGGKQ